jgi:hypothetical protein
VPGSKRNRPWQISRQGFRRHGSVIVGVPATMFRRGLVCLSITALAVVAVVVRDHARPPRLTVTRSASRNMEAAGRSVLPFRQSGLIAAWVEGEPEVVVTRESWEGLTEEAKRKLCQEIAAAKDTERLRILDDTSWRTIATCSPSGSYTSISKGDSPLAVRKRRSGG